MLAYKIVVNDVQTSENKVVCLARIDNYPDMLNCMSIGQSITTEPIQINFDDSIGQSYWILIFYPKGRQSAISFKNKQEEKRLKFLFIFCPRSIYLLKKCRCDGKWPSQYLS